jgi:hypothetical protein
MNADGLWEIFSLRLAALAGNLFEPSDLLAGIVSDRDDQLGIRRYCLPHGVSKDCAKRRIRRHLIAPRRMLVSELGILVCLAQ